MIAGLRRRAWLLVSLLAGCPERPAPVPVADSAQVDILPSASRALPAATATGVSPVVEPPALQAVAGDDVAHGLVVRACRELPCAGPGARIAVLRDGAGRAGGLRFDGGPSTCSHPPALYLNHRGQQVHSVAQRPVGAGEAAAIRARTEAAIAPFREAEKVPCAEVLEGRWAPAAESLEPRKLPLKPRPDWEHASYVVVAHVFDLQRCPPCADGAACAPCEPHVRAQSHPEHNTAERLLLLPISPTGVSPGASVPLVQGGWYAFVVEPRREPRRPWGTPVTLLAARPVRDPGP